MLNALNAIFWDTAYVHGTSDNQSSWLGLQSSGSNLKVETEEVRHTETLQCVWERNTESETKTSTLAVREGETEQRVYFRLSHTVRESCPSSLTGHLQSMEGWWWFVSKKGRDDHGRRDWVECGNSLLIEVIFQKPDGSSFTMDTLSTRTRIQSNKETQ